jgi:hypothetical protein
MVYDLYSSLLGGFNFNMFIFGFHAGLDHKEMGIGRMGMGTSRKETGNGRMGMGTKKEMLFTQFYLTCVKEDLSHTRKLKPALDNIPSALREKQLFNATLAELEEKFFRACLRQLSG